VPKPFDQGVSVKAFVARSESRDSGLYAWPELPALTVGRAVDVSSLWESRATVVFEPPSNAKVSSGI
jgi:hypothetical protein